MSVRLFVGMPLPEGTLAELEALCRTLPAVRPARNLHLTLRFLGEVPDARPFARTLAEVSPRGFPLSLAGLDFFGRGILVARLAPSPALRSLKNRVDQALARAGLEPEKRPFAPHITLSRLKSPPGRELRDLARAQNISLQWQAGAFCLYQSQLLPGGARHSVLNLYAPEA